ncbi:unnamed protein product [Taenia asiatica]|uniref:Homeobox domain-containing protein n=1 Tax=Taenia asiatica TaxID=60517 RepID=A0A0R3VZ16_TAEAS|nr:unnamed protein product [Taenia asiatica]
MLYEYGASSEERPVVPDGEPYLSPQQLALLAFIPGLQQQVQQATPPTPKEAEQAVSALAKPPVLLRSDPLLVPQSTSTPKPVPEQTSCIDLSLHPEQGGSSVQPRTTTTLPISPALNSLALGDSSKLRQQQLQPQVQQPFLLPSTCQQLPANALTFPSYSFLQQLAAALFMPKAEPILAPVKAEQLQVRTWFQNHRYKTKRAGGKVFDEEGSVTQPKVRAVERSVPSANSWSSSPGEGYGRAESMQSRENP